MAIVNETDSVEFTLSHHGVKGQRWGERKAKPIASTTNSSKSSLGRKKAEKILAISGAVLLGSAAFYAASRYGVKNFKPVTLEVGRALQNVNDKGNDVNLNKVTFATFKNSDNKKYASKFADELLGRVGTKKVYSTVLKAKEPIKAPSRHQTSKMFEEWKQANSINPSFKYSSYQRGLMATGAKESDAKSFVSYVKTKGYNALQDTLDANNSYKAQTPLMLFNGANTVTTFGSTVVRDILEHS